MKRRRPDLVSLFIHSLITYNHCHIGDLLARNMLGYYSGISNGIVDDHPTDRATASITIRDPNGMNRKPGLYRFIRTVYVCTYFISPFLTFRLLLSSCNGANRK